MLANNLKKIPLKALLPIAALSALIIFELVYFGYLTPSLRFGGDIGGARAASAEAAAEANRLIDTCFSQKDRWGCYQEKLKELTRKTSFSFAVDTLNAAQEIDPVLRDCHVLAHYISQEAARQNPEQWKDLLLNQIDVNACGTGYLHGVIETYVGDNAGKNIDAPLLNEICALFGDEFKIQACAHLFAHLLVLYHDGEIKKPLEECGELDIPAAAGYRERLLLECYIGVFMEKHQKNVLADHGIADKPEITDAYVAELERGCKQYGGLKGEACWHEMGEIYSKLYKYKNPQKVYDSCGRAPSVKEAEQCSSKAIVPLTLYWERDTAEELKEVCAPYNSLPQKYEYCLHYMISTLMHYTVKYADRGVLVCENALEPHRPGCFRHLAQLLNRFASGEKDNYCRLFPKEYQPLCI